MPQHGDLDLRKLRYFVTLAELLNYGRAAESLHVAQPVLSRQIRSFEADLGATLFERDSTGTRLTEAGTVLLPTGKSLLAAAAALQTDVAAAGTPKATLTVGVMPGLLATAAAAEFEAAYPRCAVSIQRVGWDQQVDLVQTGALDVVIGRDAPRDAELQITPLTEEPRDVVLPVNHPLATAAQVSPTELAHEVLLQDGAVAPEWVQVAPRRLRMQVRAGGYASTVEEKLELVANGRGFVILPRSTTAAYRRPDVSIVETVGFAPSRVAAFTRIGESAARDAFVAIAARHTERLLTT